MSDFPLEGGFSARAELLVRALLADLDTVMAALEPERQERLRALVADVDGRSAKPILLELEDLLLWADLPPEHPVIRALSTDRRTGQHGVTSTMTPDDVLNLLRVSMRGSPDPASDVAVRPGADSAPQGSAVRGTASSVGRAEPVLEHGSYEAVLQRLRALPSLSPEEVRGTGVDPELPDLIRLLDGGSVRLPRFQFDPLGPRAVVLEVNRALGAEHDPWGVASWWIDLHAWSGRAPVELLDEDGGVEELGQLAWAEVRD